MAAQDQSRQQVEVMHDSDACRDAFEDWYSGGWEHPQAVERDGEGYKLLGADNAWAVWDAAWRSAKASA